MIYDILHKKIEDAGLAVAGETLFHNTLPATQRIGIMTRSPLAGIRVDANLPNYYRPDLQLIVRHTDPVIGSNLADEVMDVLMVEGEQEHYPATGERGEATIQLFCPRELPIFFPRLDGNGYEWSLNFVTAFTCER